MKENKVIIFMVEGPSDEDALVVPLENELVSKKIRVKTKVLHTDILTKYSDGEKFETTTEEKRKISKVFSNACYEDFTLYIKLFNSEEVKRWEDYNSSYSGIETTEDRASNMNCLLDELEIINLKK